MRVEVIPMRVNDEIVEGSGKGKSMTLDGVTRISVNGAINYDTATGGGGWIAPRCTVMVIVEEKG